MRIKNIVASLLVAGLSITAIAAEPGTHEIKFPKDVNALLQRETSCYHWGGEEAYSKARAAQINAAMAKDTCDALSCDRQKILNKYKSDSVMHGNIEKSITEINEGDDWKTEKDEKACPKF